MNLNTLTLLHKKLWFLHKQKLRELQVLRQTPPGGDQLYVPPAGYTALSNDCKHFAFRLTELDTLIAAEKEPEREDKEMDELASEFLSPEEIAGNEDAVKELNNQRATNMLMDCADFFGETLAEADERAWKHVLCYAPAEIKRKLLAP